MTDNNMIAEGQYRARAMTGELGETQKGNPQAVVTFRLDGGEIRTWFGSFSNTTLKDGRTVAESTLRSLRHAGWDGKEITDLSMLGGTDEKPVYCMVTIGHEKDLNGVVRDRIRWVNGLGGTAKPLGNDAKKSLQAQLRGQIAKVNSEYKAPAADGDDLPF